MQDIAIIGAGRVGRTLGLALQEKGYKIIGVVTSKAETTKMASKQLKTDAFADATELSQKAEIVLITTPDRQIKAIAEEIAAKGGFKPGQVVIHTSGAHSSDLLIDASRQGACRVSIHPLQTFPDVEQGLKSLPGTYFAVEGEKGALAVAGQLVRDLEGHYFEINKELKPLYHASACIVCNYLVTLLDVGLEFFKKTSLKEQSIMPLLPLIKATVENAASKGTAASLTGPIARGDTNTIASHIDLIDKHLPEYKHLYSKLGELTVQLAQKKGTLNEGAGKELNKLFGGVWEDE